MHTLTIQSTKKRNKKERRIQLSLKNLKQVQTIKKYLSIQELILHNQLLLDELDLNLQEFEL